MKPKRLAILTMLLIGTINCVPSWQDLPVAPSDTAVLITPSDLSKAGIPLPQQPGLKETFYKQRIGSLDQVVCSYRGANSWPANLEYYSEATIFHSLPWELFQFLFTRIFMSLNRSILGIKTIPWNDFKCGTDCTPYQLTHNGEPIGIEITVYSAHRLYRIALRGASPTRTSDLEKLFNTHAQAFLSHTFEQ